MDNTDPARIWDEAIKAAMEACEKVYSSGGGSVNRAFQFKISLIENPYERIEDAS